MKYEKQIYIVIGKKIYTIYEYNILHYNSSKIVKES